MIADVGDLRLRRLSIGRLLFRLRRRIGGRHRAELGELGLRRVEPLLQHADDLAEVLPHRLDLIAQFEQAVEAALLLLLLLVDPRDETPRRFELLGLLRRENVGANPVEDGEGDDPTEEEREDESEARHA